MGCGGGLETSSRSEETPLLAVPERPEPPGPTYSIVFAAPVGEHSEIFGLDPATGERTQITSLGRFSEFPVWAPTGDHIAFFAMTEESADLMLLDLVSGETSTVISDYSELADWGPGAEYLLITRGGEAGGLHTYDMVTGEEDRIETGSTADAYARWARQAPVIAYESTRDGNPEIYVTWLETGKTSRLTENEHLDEWPSPSPDGEWIAWAAGAEEDKNLWVMRSDGSAKRQITTGLLFGDAFPEWSPDGEWIVLTVNENDTSVLKLIDPLSGAVTDLGPGAAASWR